MPDSPKTAESPKTPDPATEMTDSPETTATADSPDPATRQLVFAVQDAVEFRDADFPAGPAASAPDGGVSQRDRRLAAPGGAGGAQR